MNRILLLVCCIVLSWNADAKEVAGVRLDDNIRLDGVPLLLNGAALRSVPFSRIYVIGLYTAEVQHSADKILADGRPMRIEMHIVVKDALTERFLRGFHRGIEKNQSGVALAALRGRLDEFDAVCSRFKRLRRGDVVVFDWLHDDGTHVSLNGAEVGRIAGGDFFRAVLSIWIGAQPAADDVKQALLGG